MYLDMNLKTEELQIDWEKDTRDGGDHLNFAGATKVTAFLGSYLKGNYALSDHRQDEVYSSWNEDLENCGMNF